jgi:hypothetical protein
VRRTIDLVFFALMFLGSEDGGTLGVESAVLDGDFGLEGWSWGGRNDCFGSGHAVVVHGIMTGMSNRA